MGHRIERILRKLNCRYVIDVVKFRIKGRVWYVVVSLTVLIILGILALFSFDTLRGFWMYVQPISSLTTLAVAVVIWYGEAKQDWQKGMPKRLTVSFEDDSGKEYFRCEEAYLSDVADIRAFGQHLGKEMNGGGRAVLNLQPFMKQEAGKISENPTGRIIVDKIYGQKIMLYDVTFYLASDPFLAEDSKKKFCIWSYKKDPAEKTENESFTAVEKFKSLFCFCSCKKGSSEKPKTSGKFIKNYDVKHDENLKLKPNEKIATNEKVLKQHIGRRIN